MKRLLLPTAVAVLTLAACGGDESTSQAATVSESTTAGIRLVAPTDAAATIESPPEDLVILDVRTPEEFAEGHIDGAVMIDFYRPDFADEIATLDPTANYVVYCRSGNRSGQTTTIMEDLGFTSVEDVDGGVLAWQGAGLPLVTD